MIFEDIGNSVVTAGKYYDEDDTIIVTEKQDFMKKMNKKQMIKFPRLVDHSIICQSYYIAMCGKCTGCDLAVDGCESVFASGCN
jgi:hypothetical protein